MVIQEMIQHKHHEGMFGWVDLAPNQVQKMAIDSILEQEKLYALIFNIQIQSGHTGTIEILVVNGSEYFQMVQRFQNEQ